VGVEDHVHVGREDGQVEQDEADAGRAAHPGNLEADAAQDLEDAADEDEGGGGGEGGRDDAYEPVRHDEVHDSDADHRGGEDVAEANAAGHGAGDSMDAGAGAGADHATHEVVRGKVKVSAGRLCRRTVRIERSPSWMKASTSRLSSSDACLASRT
jgi:hypothetical protein